MEIKLNLRRIQISDRKNGNFIPDYLFFFKNESMELKERKCKPCEGGILSLSSRKIEIFLKQINEDWKVIENKKLRREFRFVNFRQTMEFVNKVAEISEEEGHHPELMVGYGHCEIEIWTHAIGGLSENDFILAAKIDELV